ncbi:hypothetical protein [Herbaspirillum sp. meg3]|uniref:hypothetical protein n=1 Tax=Herbaspirillum sp. meg3 TaxID=2025949 RepID=UPI0012FD48A0|nr:hypothetical protein [Herbaspirillum sp. meg3]
MEHDVPLYLISSEAAAPLAWLPTANGVRAITGTRNQASEEMNVCSQAGWLGAMALKIKKAAEAAFFIDAE